MRKHTIRAMLALLLAGGLAACDGSSVVGPDGGLGQVLLDAMVDEDLTDAVLADVAAALSSVEATPFASAQALAAVPNPDNVEAARALLEQARQKFQEARQAWLRGENAEAQQLALEGRLLVAEALVLVFGEEAYDRMLERVDQLIAWLEERIDGEASELLSRIRELRDEAAAKKLEYDSSQLQEDLIAATERLILAVQYAHRDLAHHRRHQMVNHARHTVFMAAMALQLAGEIAAPEPTPEQQIVLRHMTHLFEEAQLALSTNHFRLAFVLGREVVNLGLIVVVLDPDLPENKVLALIEVSDGSIAEAEAAVGDLPADSFLVLLLDAVKLLQTRAIQISDTQPFRAIYILWHVAVSAEGITEMASQTSPAI